MADEKRRHQRVAFHAEVMMGREGKSWRCRLADISLKGVLVEFPQEADPEIGEVYDMEFRLGIDVEIRMRMRVVHRHGLEIGLSWSDIDIESLSHLRRLLELNMPDPDELDSELEALR